MVKAISSEMLFLSTKRILCMYWREGEGMRLEVLVWSLGHNTTRCPFLFPLTLWVAQSFWFFLSRQGSPQSPLMSSFHWDRWPRNCPTTALILSLSIGWRSLCPSHSLPSLWNGNKMWWLLALSETVDEEVYYSPPSTLCSSEGNLSNFTLLNPGRQLGVVPLPKHSNVMLESGLSSKNRLPLQMGVMEPVEEERMSFHLHS